MNKNENKKAVVIISGGMDSTTLLYDVIAQGYETYALSFDYNQKHKKELDCAKATCEKLQVPHKTVDLNVLNQVAPSALTRDDWEVPEGHYEDENMKQTVVPNRNMVLISLAASYAMGLKADKIFYGAHSGDHDIYPDCRKIFVDAMKVAVGLADWHPVELEAPYIDIDKGDIAIKGKELGVDYSLTWTCYKGKDKACGKCGSCTERLEAFEKAGIKDPVEYE
jgi:7-cyano-7-deazaguanine synthase